MYATNIYYLLEEMGGAKDFKVDLGNDIVGEMCIVSKGQKLWPKPAPKQAPVQTPPPKKEEAPAKPAPKEEKKPRSQEAKNTADVISLIIYIAIAAAVGQYAPDNFIPHVGVLALACVVGWTIIWNVTPALHTPLMSVTNAISGIVILSGMTMLEGKLYNKVQIMAAVSIFVAAINIGGGFWVTQKMLLMFKKK